MVPTASNCPAFVGKIAVSPGASAPHQDVLPNLVPRNKVSFVSSHRLAEGAIVFNANARWVGGKQLGYDGLVVYQLRRCLGSGLDADGQEYVPGFHPEREMDHTPLARLGLHHALSLKLEGIGAFLDSGTQKAIKVSKFTFTDFLDQVLGQCGGACGEGGDQEFCKAARTSCSGAHVWTVLSICEGGGTATAAAAA